MPTSRVGFLGIGFDRMTLRQVLDRLRDVTAETTYSYLVTPNVDHVVRLNESAPYDKLAPLYERAAVCVCDSRVLARIARFQDIDLPVVPGSDLTLHLLHEVVRPGDRIAIVGGDEALVAILRAQFPDLVLLHHQPPQGLRQRPHARQQAAVFIADSGARFALVAVGSPQQEMIASAVLERGNATGMALCVGASLDFIAGRQRRAPVFLQQLGLEWAYRLMSDPRRMWRRYLIEGPRIFLLAARFRRNELGR